MNARGGIVVVAALLSALVGSNSVSRATPPADADSVILIQNATILTVSHGIIENGSILIKDGKIAEVGSSIKAPAGARVIDAAGQFVMPGIIDCHSHIAIEGEVNEAVYPFPRSRISRKSSIRTMWAFTVILPAV
jgi:imidazolonepropionase-like amidohydrolase